MSKKKKNIDFDFKVVGPECNIVYHFKSCINCVSKGGSHFATVF